jgi:hypothetical protein
MELSSLEYDLDAGIVLLRTDKNPCRFAYGYPDPAAGTVLPPEPIRLRADMPAEHDPLTRIRYAYGRT